MHRLTDQTVTTAPRQLMHYGSIRGFAPNNSPGGLLFFGAIFAGIGTIPVLAGLRLIDLPGRLNVPHWLFALIGALFVFAGLFVLQMAWRAWRFERDSARARRRFPEEPAMADRPWNPHGESSNLASKAWRSTQIALFVTLLAVPGAYFVFTDEKMPLFFKALISLGAPIMLWACADAARRWLRFVKFGRSELRFSRFPFRLGEPVWLTWIAPAGCSGEASGRFTLRAVVERHELSPYAGRRKSGTLVHEQRWAGELSLPGGARLTPGEQVELVFHPPAEAPVTTYHAEQPVFWKLEVALSLPGLDYKETYPVPVYASARSSSTPAHA